MLSFSLSCQILTLFSPPVVRKLIREDSIRDLLSGDIDLIITDDDRAIRWVGLEEFSSEVSVELLFVLENISGEIIRIGISYRKWIELHLTVVYCCYTFPESHEVILPQEITQRGIWFYREYLARMFIESDIVPYGYTQSMSFIGFYFCIYMRISCTFFSAYTLYFSDFCDKKSPSTVYMRPEMFLIYDLERSRIFRWYRFEDSFVFYEIHTTGRVDHFSTDFQSDDSGIEEFFLEASDCFYIFYMPVLCRISAFIESTLATTRCIEEDTIEGLWCMPEVLSRIESHSDIRTSHAVEILEELGYALASGLIRDDEAFRIGLTQLGRLPARTRCHIEYDEIIWNTWSLPLSLRILIHRILIYDSFGCSLRMQIFLYARKFRIREYLYCSRSCELLYIKIPHQMIRRVSYTPLERMKIWSSIEWKNTWYIGPCEDKSVSFETFFYFHFFPGFYTYRAGDSFFQRCEEWLKLLRLLAKKSRLKVFDEARIDRHTRV